MKFLYLLVLILTSCSVNRSVYSQSLHTTSNRALRVYNEGKEAFDFFDYKNAEICFKNAITIDRYFYEAYMMLGELYTNQGKYADAAVRYRQAVKIDSLAYKPVFFSLANAEFKAGEYQQALLHYNVYRMQGEIPEKNQLLVQKNRRNCEFAIEAMKHPVPFNPVSLGSYINSKDDEYWPSITADGQMFMFTRQTYVNNYTGSYTKTQEDFYVSHLTGDGWQTAVNAGEPLNTRENEGAQTLSSNGKYMYFTSCDRPGGLGSCDLYFSSFNDSRWSEPFNLGSPVNTPYWESTPSVNADGTWLFFSSNRPGGFGGKDLWYTTITRKGSWSKPVNMGSVINTSGDEMSPFIHFDGRSLYFSSDGRVGMGGFDIYLSRMKEDSTWTEPQNLGYPINTYSDEMGLVIESGGQKAYFSSLRDASNGKDIFTFNLYEAIRPDPVAYLKGKVTDKETGKLLKANYELINLSTNKVTVKSTTGEDGNFLVCLPSGFNYGLNVIKTGYLFYSENFMFEGIHSAVEPLIKRINLSPLKIGEKISLTNVFYAVDSWELKKESVIELNNLSDLLKENKDLVVEIGGYTDSTGTDAHNLGLSEKRALSVVNYLVSKGISADRLKYKGYGNTSPIGNNVTVEGRQLNRRTEAKIIGRKK